VVAELSPEARRAWAHVSGHSLRTEEQSYRSPPSALQIGAALTTQGALRTAKRRRDGEPHVAAASLVTPPAFVASAVGSASPPTDADSSLERSPRPHGKGLPGKVPAPPRVTLGAPPAPPPPTRPYVPPKPGVAFYDPAEVARWNCKQRADAHLALYGDTKRPTGKQDLLWRRLTGLPTSTYERRGAQRRRLEHAAALPATQPHAASSGSEETLDDDPSEVVEVEEEEVEEEDSMSL
jgi:hypothetical protein